MIKIPLAKEGFIFILPLLIITLLMLLFSFYWVALIFGLGFVFVTSFFRDPERSIPNEPNVIVSPADGKVTEIITEIIEILTVAGIGNFLLLKSFTFF